MELSSPLHLLQGLSVVQRLIILRLQKLPQRVTVSSDIILDVCLQLLAPWKTPPVLSANMRKKYLIW